MTGKDLKRLRERNLGWTQTELAYKMGLSQPVISQREHDHCKISYSEIVLLKIFESIEYQSLPDTTKKLLKKILQEAQNGYNISA